MAVGTGYSKVATNGLVFAYDIGDIVNSYRGEPTTNLLPSAPTNALPTYGNGWATYNTNQYCGNNGCAVYWTIPSIASVSNNIVTTVSAHQIRTYDVINPNATGGGVTAGTNYLAKKISDTQFSLHAYNSSQDGSQGYTNPTTGLPVVWDSIGLDQRISVNASGFPTGWWGAPHLPNSGIVKEIIPNGFTNPNSGQKTDCIRLKWIRPDGVTDGMAYGVDPYVTIGSPVNVSFYARAVTPSAVGQSISYQNYNYGGPGGASGFSFGASWGAVGEWVRNSYSFTPTHNYLISYWFPSTGNMMVDIANIQIEQKNHTTQFTTGTRSSTNGLLDVSGRGNIITLNNSYDSNANFYFDGSDDYLDLTPASVSPVNEISVEFVTAWDGSLQNNSIIAGGTGGNQDLSLHLPWSDGNVYWDAGRPFNRIYKYAQPSEYLGNHHWVCTKNANTGIMEIYLDGNLWHSGTGLTSSIPSLAEVNIGRYNNGSTRAYYYKGNIRVAKIYSRALAAGEVRDNYSHYKTRFSLP
jgi:hypothetical protein